MAGGIYLVQGSGELVEMTEQPYDAEARLQRLLADYPNLLAGDQVNPTAPRRWLLVRQEAAVPSEEGGAGRWSLDHLFLDQDAVPTLIEVKRSTDTRIRREVVGQMLDYAANAVVYWPSGTIQAQFETSCRSRGLEPDDVLTEFIADERDAESFWQMAKHNLQAGRIRMVFVADVIPPELQRIVEFLNGQMDPAEVLALEVRQFVGQGLQALVPKLIGQTAAAQQAKATSTATSGRQWDEASFFEELTRRRGQSEAGVARTILRWAETSGLRIWWGMGKADGSFLPMVDHARGTDGTVAIYTYGRLEIQFQRLVSRSKLVPNHPFASDEQRMALLDRLNRVPGVNMDVNRISARPAISLSVLTEAATLTQFLSVLDWLVAELRSHPSNS